MYSVDEIASTEINKQLNMGNRVISIKLPTHEEFGGYLNINNSDVYFWDIANKKLCLSLKAKKVFNWLVWLIKVLLFVLQNVFTWSISIMTIFSLSVDFVYLGGSNKKDRVAPDLIKAVSKHIRILKKPCDRYKRISKVICLIVDEKTPSEQLNSALLLADLIDNKYISDSAIIILSKVELLRPPQIILPIYGLSVEDSAFVNDFGMDILTYIRQEDYVSATRYISSFIKNKVLRIYQYLILSCSVWHFVLRT